MWRPALREATSRSPGRPIGCTPAAPEGLALRAVAADPHRAPLARPVAGVVVERPAAVGVRAGLEPAPRAVGAGDEHDAEGQGERRVGPLPRRIEPDSVAGAEPRQDCDP